MTIQMQSKIKDAGLLTRLPIYNIMKTEHIIPLLLLVGCCAVSAQTNSDTNGITHAKTTRPKIYDESADGSKQIADALATATKEHKHVLLQFGANWCGWCHKLHKLFETDKNIAEALKSDYVVVMIDVNKGHNNDTDTKYGHPMRFGLPALVVLNADGKQLVTQDTGKLEEGDHHSPDKVMIFLKDWAPKQKL